MASVSVYPVPRNNRILVKNIPVKTNHDKLIIYFQKKKHGGCGDVISVTFPLSKYHLDQAVIVFEECETVVSILQHPTHILHGNQLVVSEFPQQQLGDTQALISVTTMIKLFCIPDIYSYIRDSTGVAFMSKDGLLYITGLWYQVSAAADKIEMNLSNMTVQNATADKLDDNAKMLVLNTILDQLGVASETTGLNDEEICSVDVEEDMFDFMKICQHNLLSTLSKKYKVEVQQSGSKVTFTPNKLQKVGNSNVIDATKTFQRRYEKFSAQVMKDSIKMKNFPNSTTEKMNEAVDYIVKKNPKIHISKEMKKNELTALALSKSDIEQIVNTLHQMFPPTPNKELAAYDVYNKKVKIVVIHGNFQDEISDALLSEVDFMGHGKVVAVGGDAVKAELSDWGENSFKNIRRSSNGGGRIQSKSIIHYSVQFPVSETDLEKMIMEGIEYANTLKMRSITLPLNCLGEGLRRKDVQRCIMNSILSFLSTCQVRNQEPNISSIRLVHDDLPETQDLLSGVAEMIAKMESSIPSTASASSSSENASGSDLKNNESQECCAICLEDFNGNEALKTLPCSHVFHQSCIDKAFKVAKKCPMCMRTYGKPEGTQPRNATMTTRCISTKLSGYKCDTILIDYSIPSGIQGPEHPNPGRPYHGTSRRAYLPNDSQGREIVLLLRKAFEARLIFTVGRSVTTGADNCVTWNDIHHKTSTSGGPANFGYPDPGYLTRLKQELADKGITN